MILMAVLGTILIAMALAARMGEVGVDAQKLLDYSLNRENNYQVARSAVEMGCRLLEADSGDTDSFQDMWAAGTVTLEWEGKKVAVSIVDEESKFPLSAMQRQPDNCEYLQEALVRFFSNAGLGTGEEACDRFLDWVDADSQRRSRGGEGSDYPELTIKDSPVDSLEEILVLPGWEQEPIYPVPRGQQSLQSVSAQIELSDSGAGASLDGSLDTTATPNSSEATKSNEAALPSYHLEAPSAQTLGQGDTSPWREWMSVHSPGLINLNTAPKEILLCLDESMTQTLVDEIDTRRRSEAFKNVDELRNLAGMDADLLFRIQDYLCVKSQIFTIEAVVFNSPGRLTLRATVDRSSGPLKVLRWRIF